MIVLGAMQLHRTPPDTLPELKPTFEEVQPEAVRPSAEEETELGR